MSKAPFTKSQSWRPAGATPKPVTIPPKMAGTAFQMPNGERTSYPNAAPPLQGQARLMQTAKAPVPQAQAPPPVTRVWDPATGNYVEEELPPEIQAAIMQTPKSKSPAPMQAAWPPESAGAAEAAATDESATAPASATVPDGSLEAMQAPAAEAGADEASANGSQPAAESRADLQDADAQDSLKDDEGAAATVLEALLQATGSAPEPGPGTGPSEDERSPAADDAASPAPESNSEHPVPASAGDSADAVPDETDTRADFRTGVLEESVLIAAINGLAKSILGVTEFGDKLDIEALARALCGPSSEWRGLPRTGVNGNASTAATVDSPAPKRVRTDPGPPVAPPPPAAPLPPAAPPPAEDSANADLEDFGVPGIEAALQQHAARKVAAAQAVAAAPQAVSPHATEEQKLAAQQLHAQLLAQWTGGKVRR